MFANGLVVFAKTPETETQEYGHTAKPADEPEDEKRVWSGSYIRPPNIMQ